MPCQTACSSAAFWLSFLLGAKRITIINVVHFLKKRCLAAFSLRNLILLPRSLCFFYRDDPLRRFFSIIRSRPAPWSISSPSWNASWQLVKLVHNSARGSSSGCFLQKLEISLLDTQLWIGTEQQLSAWWERVMETQAEFHFSWVYTFSAMLSSLRNWANHDRYRLRPSTPAQLCWSSSRLQPLQNNNLIKFAIIQPSTLNHDKNLWNFPGAPDETTCLTVFFRCPSALALICMKLFNVCTNKLFLSLSLSLFAHSKLSLLYCNKVWDGA